MTFALGSAASGGGGAGAGGSARRARASSTAPARRPRRPTPTARDLARFTANDDAGAVHRHRERRRGVTEPGQLHARQPRRQAAHDHGPRRGGRGPATVGDALRQAARRSTVRGADGKPLQGATVTFTLGASGGGSGGTGSASAAAASFVGGASQATATTDAAGIATSPRAHRQHVAGTFTATATRYRHDATRRASRSTTSPAGRRRSPPGVAATESTTVGTRFPIPLAVTVTDKRRQPGRRRRSSRFTAPALGASGRFARQRDAPSGACKTNANGHRGRARRSSRTGTPGRLRRHARPSAGAARPRSRSSTSRPAVE